MSQFVLRTSRFLVALTLYVACADASAQRPESQEELSRRIDQLIQNLFSDVPTTRDSAYSELFHIGEAAIERLRDAAKKESSEHGKKLANLANKIEWGRATRHLRLLALGLITYEDVYGTLPAAYSTSSEGKPLLSWRVSILPFIGEQEQSLFDEFQRNEPWDSEHNKKLISKMPDVYRSPTSKAGPGMTNYLGVGGEHGVIAAPAAGAPRGRPANGIRISNIKDGRSDTALFVECTDNASVVWTKPEEWVPDKRDPARSLVGPAKEPFLVVFVDGYIQRVPPTVSSETLNRIFSRDDGMPINFPREMP